MRRIVVIAAGPAGVTCATRLKRRLPESEVNLILPPTLESLRTPVGPTGHRLAACLPNTELLASRELGVLEARDIMPDLENREVTLSSDRGRLTVRYEDLVVEVSATARIPRALQGCSNVFGWPVSGFAADPAACDAALAASAQVAARAALPVLVVGAGMAALDAVFLAREAGASVRWLCTAASEAPGGTPDIEPHLRGLVSRGLGDEVSLTPLADVPAAVLVKGCSVVGDRLESLSLPDGEAVACSCCLWTTPLLARHPLLREEGFSLDAYGRMEAAQDVEEELGVFLMGDGAAFPGARPARAHLAGGTRIPAWPGGEEAAMASALSLSARLARRLAVRADAVRADEMRPASFAGSNAALPEPALPEPALPEPALPEPTRPGLFGLRRASMPGLTVLRAGLSLADAERAGLLADHVILARSLNEQSGNAEFFRLAKASSNRDGFSLRGLDSSVLPPEGKTEQRRQTETNQSFLRLILVLIGHKQSGTLLGVQVFGSGGGSQSERTAVSAAAEGLFGMALAALAREEPLDALSTREAAGLPGCMLARAASMLTNKFDGPARGVSPDELLASAAAGAEFFTLDLRSKAAWEAGHLPEARNIPLPQLKKRIQNEVPRYTPLVLVSATGDDAYVAARRLAGLGATELYVLDGGMDLWPYDL